MDYVNYQKLGLLLTGLTLNGLILLPVQAQIKRVTFLPTIVTDASAAPGNTGTFSGGFTWNPSLSGASANSVPVNDPGLTYNISYTGSNNVNSFTLTNANIQFMPPLASSGAWNLSSDGLFNAANITAPASSILTLQTLTTPTFIQGFTLNGIFGPLATFDLTQTNPGPPPLFAGDFASGNPGIFIQVDTIPIPFEFSENLAVLTFLVSLGLGYLYRNRNSFLKGKKDKFNEQEIKNDLLEMTSNNK